MSVYRTIGPLVYMYYLYGLSASTTPMHVMLVINIHFDFINAKQPISGETWNVIVVSHVKH